VGFSGNSIQRGNVDRSVMQNALAQIGQRIGHPELPRLPFVAYGFSNGSGAPASLAIMFPERTIAWVAGHPGGSWMLTHPGLEKSIGLVVHGMKDPWFTGHDQEKVVASMRRKHDAPVGMAISPIMGHGCGIHVILKFLRSAIAMRDPRPTDDGTVTLKPIRIEDGALVEPYDKAAGGAQTLAALPYKDAASVTNMMWYPDMAFAEFVQAYAARDKK
jgi:hypothetical protein